MSSIVADAAAWVSAALTAVGGVVLLVSAVQFEMERRDYEDRVGRWSRLSESERRVEW